jgi:hypothetical protein
VFGFFGVGDDVQQGWAAARDLTTFAGFTPPTCGLDEAVERSTEILRLGTGG